MKTWTLITGASGGIGCALAKEFAKHGHNLLLVARNENKLAALKDELEKDYTVSAEIIAIDLSEKDAAVKLHNETAVKGYRVDNLVNNAGFGDWGAFLSSDWERQYKLLELNIAALTQLTYLYGNDMKKANSGHILNLSSVAAFCAGPYMSLYYATKGYVLSFSEAVAEELKETGVTVTVLCPGPTATDFEKNAEMKNSKMFAHPSKAESVAKRGYKAMQKGKTVVYHSAMTKFGNIASRLTSRKFMRNYAKHINGVEK